MTVVISLPAYKYSQLYSASATIEVCSEHIEKEVRINIIEKSEIDYKEIAKLAGAKLERTPVFPGFYTVRTSWEVLCEYCKGAEFDDVKRTKDHAGSCRKTNACALVVEQRRFGSIKLGVAYIIPPANQGDNTCGVERRSDLVALFTYSFPQLPQQVSSKQYAPIWWLIFLPKRVLSEEVGEQGALVNVSISLVHRPAKSTNKQSKLRYKQNTTKYETSFTALVVPASKLGVYPAKVFIEEDVNIVASGIANRVRALLTAVYLGGVAIVHTDKFYAQIPEVVLYDMEGKNLPQRIIGDTEGVRISIDLTAENVRELLGALEGNLSALAKVLVNNIVAKVLLAQCGSKRSWIFERIIDAQVGDKTAIFTSPMLWNIKKVYKSLLLHKKGCCDNLQSCISRYASILSEIASENEKCGRTISSALLSLFGKPEVRKPDSVFSAVGLVALMLGAHGASHALARALGIANKQSMGEVIRIEVSPGVLKMLSSIRFFRELENAPPNAEIIYNSIFRIKKLNTANLSEDKQRKTHPTMFRATIALYSLRGEVPNLSQLKDALSRVLSPTGGSSDRCEMYNVEERDRLGRVWRVVRSSEPVLEEFDKYVGRRISDYCPQPPREIFRFLLRDLVRDFVEASQKAGQGNASAQDVTEYLRGDKRKLLQYIWPRYIKFCGDGCHLCVRVARGACALPPIQEALYTSKTLAKKLLSFAGLL